MKDMQGLASLLAAKGRYGDDTLVHMSQGEVTAMNRLAPLTVNPETGLPEAFNFASLLPILGGVAGGMLAGPLGISGALGAGAGAGLTSLAVNRGDILSGIRDGLLSYAGASLMGNLGELAPSAAAGAEGPTSALAASEYAPLAGFNGPDLTSGFTPSLEGFEGPDMGFGDAVGGSAPLAPQGGGVFNNPFAGAGDAVLSNAKSGLGNAMSAIEADPMNLARAAGKANVVMPGLGGLAAGAMMPNVSTGATALPGAPGPGSRAMLPGHDVAQAPLNREFMYPADPYAPARQGQYGSFKYFARGGSVKKKKLEMMMDEMMMPRSRMMMADGGMVAGHGGGLDDMIPATIEGRQLARLSDGEFVVPADVVSDLGDGSTKAGSTKLYNMIENVRMRKRGTPKQPTKMRAGLQALMR